EVLQEQVPALRMRQVLVKVAPGANLVPSGTVTSVTNAMESQAVLTPPLVPPVLPPDGGKVGAVRVTDGVSVAIAVSVGSGVKVAVGCSKALSVSCALTVDAAAVCTMAAELVELPPGKLHAATSTAKTNPNT